MTSPAPKVHCRQSSICFVKHRQINSFRTQSCTYLGLMWDTGAKVEGAGFRSRGNIMTLNTLIWIYIHTENYMKAFSGSLASSLPVH